MPYPLVDLASHREKIESLLHDGYNQKQVIVWLKDNCGITTTTRTLRKRLANWGLRTSLTQAQRDQVERVVCEQYKLNRTDRMIQTVLARPQNGGLVVPLHVLSRIRRMAGIKRRHTIEAKAAGRAELCSLIKNVMETDRLEKVGYRLLTVLLRSKGCTASRLESLREYLTLY
jgi:hypothetical protein